MISAIIMFMKKGVIIVPYVKKYFREILIVILVTSLYLVATSRSEIKRNFNEFENEVKELANKAVERNKAIEDRHKRIVKTVVSSYEESEKQLKEYYENNPNIRYVTINDRVQDPSCSSTGGAPRSTEGINQGLDGTQKTPTGGSSGQIQLDLGKASLEIVQCLELIKFNKEQDKLHNVVKDFK